MSLDLDARQRAMLKEMHVPVWWPETLPAEVVVEPALASAGGSAKAAGAPAAGTARVPDATPARSNTNASAQMPVARAHAPSAQVVTRPAISAVSPAPAVRADVANLDWTGLQSAVASCQACGLCEKRKHTVFGVGGLDTTRTDAAVPVADWLIVGEAPGEQEDLQGEPFVGAAGQLLDNILRAIQLDRNRRAVPDSANGQATQGVFIANVLKCRPPGNRNPEPAEVAQCVPFLQRQVELLQPKLILAMGRFAAQTLLADTVPDVQTTALGKLRGQVHAYRGIPVVVTYHPAYLLRSLGDKAKAWADLCLALDVREGKVGPR